MKYVIKSGDVIWTQEHGISVFTEYPLSANGLAMGISEINGRYPKSGTDVDIEIEQIWYVLDGSGGLIVEGETHPFTAGDMIHIPKNQPYAIDGTVKLIVASSPAWTPGQHQHLED